MEFKHFFNTYDTVGTQHTGFLQAMDFSGLTGTVTFLNELTMAFMDAYLYNELSESIVMRQWGQYMHYSRENARFEIMSTFYQDFVNALAAKLMRAEKWYQLTKTNFQSLSATDIKTIEHGIKETVKDYGEDETTRAYGEDEQTNVYGQKQDTNAYGATQQTQQRGQQKVTKDYDNVVVTVSHDTSDQHVIGLAHSETDGSTTGQLYPLGASAFVDDTKQITHSETENNAQTNTDTWGDVETATDARKDEETKAGYTDTVSDIAHTDTLTEGEHTDTLTRSEREDVETRAARRDTEQIKAYVDTERHTKYIVISPEKYYQIEKELAEIGVYDLMKDAVRETALLCVWEGGYVW